MKIFADHKAMRTFTNFYNSLSEDEQKEFGSRIRTLADKKINSDETDVFYVTVKDVRSVYRLLTKA